MSILALFIASTIAILNWLDHSRATWQAPSPNHTQEDSPTTESRFYWGRSSSKWSGPRNIGRQLQEGYGFLQLKPPPPDGLHVLPAGQHLTSCPVLLVQGTSPTAHWQLQVVVLKVPAVQVVETHLPPHATCPVGHSHLQVVVLKTFPCVVSVAVQPCTQVLLQNTWPVGHSHLQVVVLKTFPCVVAVAVQPCTQVLLPGQTTWPVGHSHLQVVVLNTFPRVVLVAVQPCTQVLLWGQST